MIRKIIGICGACIAFYIGAGFATMQEVLQYEASYGSHLWKVIAVAAIIYIYTNFSFAFNGNRLKLDNETQKLFRQSFLMYMFHH